MISLAMYLSNGSIFYFIFFKIAYIPNKGRINIV